MDQGLILEEHHMLLSYTGMWWFQLKQIAFYKIDKTKIVLLLCLDMTVINGNSGDNNNNNFFDFEVFLQVPIHLQIKKSSKKKKNTNL